MTPADAGRYTLVADLELAPGCAIQGGGAPLDGLPVQDGDTVLLRVTDTDGSPLTIDIEPLTPVHIGIGTGYGYDTDWRHGMWQGELKVEGVHIDTTTPEGAGRMFGIVDASARFRGGPHEEI